MQRRGMFLGLALLLAIVLGGCAEKESGGEGSPSETTSSPTDGPRKGGGGSDTTQIHITVEGDDVDPNGKQIEVPINEPIELHITADRAGELHVHSTPEIEIEFAAGNTTKEITIERPGVVTVELHEPEKIVMELEAS